MPAVSNSTPLIILSKIGKLDILKEYFKAVYIPQAVYLEVVLQGKGLKGSKEVDDAEWINVENINNRLAARTLSIHLGAGEAEAIILAEEKEMLLLIDDGDGRKTAKEMDLQITGTAGIILKAGLDGKLNIEETIIQLEDVGFRLSNEVKEHLLRKSKANK